MILEKLSSVINQEAFPLARNLANNILVAQAMFQAVQGKIAWTRDPNHYKKVKGTAVVGLPGAEPEEVPVEFYENIDDAQIATLYFTVGEEPNMMCRNSADPSVLALAKMIFETKASQKLAA